MLTASDQSRPLPGAVAEPSACAWFLDFDGTLVEIVEHPEDVEVPAALRDLIARLYMAAGGALAVVTGRDVERLDRFLDPLRVPVAGVHGCQFRRSPTGEVAVAAEAEMTPIRAALRDFVCDHPGLWLEDKHASLALHYRQAAEHAEAAERLAEQLARQHEGVTVQRGKSVVELRPAGVDKGSAIARFMGQAPFAGRIPVFIGDDDTDEPAFDWVNQHQGVSIRVGNAPATAAHYRVADTRAVLRWLRTRLDGVTGA